MFFFSFFSSSFSHTLRPHFHCYALLLVPFNPLHCFYLYSFSTHIYFDCFTHLSAPHLLSLVFCLKQIKKGKFQLESSLKQVELLMPDQYKATYIRGMTECKDAAVGIKNNCDAAHALITCLRSTIDIFLFP